MRLPKPRLASGAAAACAALVCTGARAGGGETSATSANPIAAENAKRGLADWQPLEPNGSPRGIEGYASETSVAIGEVLRLHVSTRPAARYQVQIYRLGWYGGVGGRLVTCLPRCQSSMQGTPRELKQPDGETGLLRASWPTSSTLRIPASWLSGYYVAKLVLATRPADWPRMGKSAVIPFIVKARPTAASRILVVSSANTEQAYNNWGGKSLYDFNSTGKRQATKISFDRPYAGSVYFYESRLVNFLERQPDLDISYATDVDVHRNPAMLLRHRLVLVNGHNEYWSRTMRGAYERARDRKVNLAFFGGNIGDWQVRYEQKERVLVGYKSAERDPDPDPLDKTTKFRLLTPPRPQCEIIGTNFDERVPEGSGRFKVNAAALKHPWFAGTGFKAGDTFAAGPGEVDVAVPGCPPYPTITFFADARNPSVAPAVRYVAPSGAVVLGVGSYALSTSLDDPRVQRFARNAILDLSRARR